MIKLDYKSMAKKEALKSALDKSMIPKPRANIGQVYLTPPVSLDEVKYQPSLTQWEINGNNFRAMGKTTKNLPPGLYQIQETNNGIVFCKKQISTHDLIQFEDSALEEVKNEIDIFWNSKDKYKQFDVQYKRGILLWGPAGSGKSSLLKLLTRDVIQRGGIAVEFQHPRFLELGMSILREIHADKPVVCIMEDIDSILRNVEQSSILNLLDGSTVFLDNIVFVATSNYPEKLDDRIKDRPSRFDKVIEVGLPSEKMRTTYLKHLFDNAKISTSNLQKWVKDTSGLTFPHLQEIFLSTHLYGIQYEAALKRLKSMSKSISSDKHRKKNISLMPDEKYQYQGIDAGQKLY